MTIVKKHDKEWHTEIDELIDDYDESLTDDEYEIKCWLKELVEDGCCDPFRIDQGDIAELMRLKGMLSEEDAYMHNFTEEDEKRLAHVLENNWDNLEDYNKVVYHVIKDTHFPKWRRPYPPTQVFLESLKEFLNMDPRLRKI